MISPQPIDMQAAKSRRAVAGTCVCPDLPVPHLHASDDVRGSVYDRANERVRAEHRAEVVMGGTGYTWACSCGRRGRGLASLRHTAQRGKDKHLDNQHKRILAEERAR